MFGLAVKTTSMRLNVNKCATFPLRGNNRLVGSTCWSRQRRFLASSSHRQSETRRKHLEQQASRKLPNKSEQQKHQYYQQPNKTKLLAVGANTVLFFGMSMWLLLFVDQYFQRREKECIARAHEELYREFGDLEELANAYWNHPAQFSCVVRLKSRELTDIFPVRVGDVVEVLEEGVGKDQNLNICRSRPKSPDEPPMISLYPMGCLQRLQPEPTQEIQAS